MERGERSGVIFSRGMGLRPHVRAMDVIVAAAVAAVLGQLAAEVALSRLNAAEVRRNANAVPAVFRDTIDDATYQRGIAYTLDKNRFGLVSTLWGAVVLLTALLSGVLPWAWEAWVAAAGDRPWAGAVFLVAVMVVFSLLDLPFDWWSRFRIEQRHGFNRGTVGLWVSDRVKGAVLGLVIGVPLIWLLLALAEWIGPWWWVAAWGVFMAFQFLLIVVYPIWILPLFNKLEPLPEGELRDRVHALAERARFGARRVEVMDGSKRLGHANAFFTGFGRFRHIVLFDTLISQLSVDEVEAVLAHEIGHFKLGHIPRTIALSALAAFGVFAATGWLAGEPRFFAAFGFSEPSVAVAFLLFVLLGGTVGFWFTPLTNALSRRHEYQADAFASALVGGPAAMIAALRKLTKENLANLTPHPLFSAFFYSHPTLVEREAALRKASTP